MLLFFLSVPVSCQCALFLGHATGWQNPLESSRSMVTPWTALVGVLTFGRVFLMVASLLAGWPYIAVILLA